jgi:pimeloyl-ACP methyl ester carboxylesterase
MLGDTSLGLASFVTLTEIVPADEPCSAEAPPSPPPGLLDTNTFGGQYPFPAEYRLAGWLRIAAQSMNSVTGGTVAPLEVLKQAAVSYYCAGVVTRTPPDTVEGATALADLTVTGGEAYEQFQSAPPLESDMLGDVGQRLRAILEAPPDQARLAESVAAILDRAYTVAWALRDPNPITRTQTRATLGWIAVSGEDDSPHRPVNTASAKYLFPQFDTSVTCEGVTIDPVRYTIALPEPDYPVVLPSPPIRQLPVDAAPVLPDDHEVILFLHGHDSNIEECADLAGPLQAAGLPAKKYAILAFDQPTSGYTQMVDHFTVAPTLPQWDGSPGSNPPTYPLLDFLVEFVISFVDQVDSVVPIKSRIAAVIGGSLGANLALRLAERDDQPWVTRVVAWSSASVWSTFNHDLAKAIPLQDAQEFMLEPETEVSRDVFFYRQFVMAAGGDPPQPQMWYSPQWPCTPQYIENDRWERREIYNQFFRRWHWRTGLEQLLFSHLNTDTPTGAPRWASNRTNTLLLAGSVDQYNWADIYSATQTLSTDMINTTPGDALFLQDVGHSIHNERPAFLAQEIASFISR